MDVEQMMDEMTPQQEARWLAFFELRSEPDKQDMVDPAEVAKGLPMIFSS